VKDAAEKAAAEKATKQAEEEALAMKQEQEEGLARKRAEEEASKVHVFPALDETSSHATELIVTVESARHLPKMDVMGTCDAFCEVEWQGQKFKTTIKKNSYSPDWNETFAFPVENISAGVSCMSVVVMDWDMMSKNDLVGEVVIPGNTLQAFLEGKHTVTMEDSFEVLNKGEAVIGNDKKPCVLNLKMRLVVPDEEASPPVTAQNSLTAQHSEAFEEVWAEYFDSYGRAYYYCETSGMTTWEKPAVKSRGGEAGSASDAERKEEGRKDKEEEERKAREDAKAAAAAAEASFLVKLKEEQDRKNREEEERKKAEDILAIQKAEEALLKSKAEQEAAAEKAASERAAAEKAAADAKLVILVNF
jgi:hypothetical protein